MTRPMLTIHKITGWWVRLIIGILINGLIFPSVTVRSAPTDNIGIQIPILAYHNVAIDPQDDEWTISTADFTAELDVLQAYGYQTVTLQDYLDYEANLKTPPAKPVILTFDDGYQGMFTDVLPALTARGMTASSFIPHRENWRRRGTSPELHLQEFHSARSPPYLAGGAGAGRCGYGNRLAFGDTPRFYWTIHRKYQRRIIEFQGRPGFSSAWQCYKYFCLPLRKWWG